LDEIKCKHCGGNKVVVTGSEMECLNCGFTWIEEKGKMIVQDVK